MVLSVSEQLMHSTIRIETLDKNDRIQGTGTGFFFNYCFGENKKVPVIVTNKHVVRNAQKGRLVFTIADETNRPVYGQKYVCVIEDFEESFLMHPEAEIDLCVMFANPIQEDYKQRQNRNLFIISINEDLIPTKEILENLSALEDVVMIGYPSGLWDEANNLPLIRRGVTAIHPKFDYNNKQDIVIDIACFPGSSGSPVGIFNQGSYNQGSTLVAGTRFIFLGILYSAPIRTEIGDIKTVTIPTNAFQYSSMKIMINLGFAVKSKKLLDFKPIIESYIK